MQLKSSLSDPTIKATNYKELQHIRDHASKEWHDFEFIKVAKSKNSTNKSPNSYSSRSREGFECTKHIKFKFNAIKFEELNNVKLSKKINPRINESKEKGITALQETQV